MNDCHITIIAVILRLNSNDYCQPTIRSCQAAAQPAQFCIQRYVYALYYYPPHQPFPFRRYPLGREALRHIRNYSECVWFREEQR